MPWRSSPQRFVSDDVVYADEDRIDADGRHCDPRLKPGYSPDFLLASAYVGRPLAFRAQLLDGFDPVADELRAVGTRVRARDACAAAASVRPCPRGAVPPHRIAATTGAEESGHVVAVLRRRGDPSDVPRGPIAPERSTSSAGRSARTRVTVVIPFRDQPQFLRTCVDSVRATAGDADLELLLVDNGSSDLETLTLIERFSGTGRRAAPARPATRSIGHVSTTSRPREAGGEVLLFLNNDIEALRTGWLDALVAQALRPDVGPPGARLLYPNRRLQHCGLVIGLTGAAGHPLVGSRLATRPATSTWRP